MDTSDPPEPRLPPSSALGSNKGTAGSCSNIADDSSDTCDSPSSNNSFGSAISLSIPDETNYTEDDLSFPLEQYKDALARKNSGNLYNLPAMKYNIPDEEITSQLPNTKAHSLELKKSNPFTLNYKERSFILHSKLSFPDIDGQNDKGPHCGRSASLHELDFPEELREQRHNQRLAKVQQNMTKDQTMLDLEDGLSNMTVYGVKAEPGHFSHTPPNTPMGAPKPLPKRGSRSQLSVVLLNKKRAQNTDKKKTGPNQIQDTVQAYERTKDGKFIPVGLHKQRSFQLPSMKEQHEREKLLKQERNTMFSQQMKMKSFIEKFPTESQPFKLPVLQRSSPGAGRGPSKPAPSLRNFFFQDAEPESIPQQKVVGTSSRNYNSVGVLRKCRYLREYTPMTKGQQLMVEKETSWQRKSNYKQTYLANVRMQLF